MKPITNTHRHDRTEEDASSKPLQSGTPDFIQHLKEKSFQPLPNDLLSRLRGQQLNIAHLIKKGFNQPILVESKEGLELSVPDPSSFSIHSVVDIVGYDHMLDVIDSRRQISVKMTAEDFARLATRSTEHDTIYNCISLEVSKTELSEQIRPPSVVTKLSWVDKCWPKVVEDRPNVSKYCLMSMADSYTDFHIDFGGTSVWYHVLKGEKIFYVLRPTEENLKAYEEWMNLKNQSEVFFGDLIKDPVYKLHVKEGNTLLIPTGWIHAVLTPCDSLVFGGNFLHSLDIELQLKIRDMEKRIKTPDKFQFPYFAITHWYAAPHVLKLLQDHCVDQIPPGHLVSGAAALLEVLKLWAGTDPKDCLVPLGYNTRKIIKDLSKWVKRAQRKVSSPAERKEEIPQVSRETMSTPFLHTDASSDSERELVMDETSTDEGEGQKPLKIRMKLSLRGKGGLPQVTEATLAVEDNKRKKSEEVEDPDILEMIKGRPQDDDFIYLDVESDPDDEAIVGTEQPDQSWCPSAKVVVRGRREARPTREHAKREVIESCIASAAARLEQRPKKRKVRIRSSGSRASSEGQTSSSTSKKFKETHQEESKSSQPPSQQRAKKGEKTPKQRLAKLMGIRRV